MPETGIEEVILPRHSSGQAVENNRYRIEWRPGSWTVAITDKISDQDFEWTAFSGSIGKANEHDSVFYPALSPGHETFTFAFDGATHSPDQCSGWRVKTRIEQLPGYSATLVMRCELLTLHTTDTPVAFAEARVCLRETDGDIEFSNYLYSSVPLVVQASAILQFTDGMECYRDFPLGEERTEVQDSYANSYIRATSEATGFTLVNFGTQRLFLNRGQGRIKTMLSRTRLFGEYTWRFCLNSDNLNAAQSARYARYVRATLPVVGAACVNSLVNISNPQLVLASLHPVDGGYEARVVNYCAVDCELHTTTSLTAVDLCGETIWQANPGDRVVLKPWELVTFRTAVSEKIELG